jgi:hypothetical protein
VVGRDWSPVSSNKARGHCLLLSNSSRPLSPIAVEACSPAVFTLRVRGTSRADSRRSGVGLAPGPQALPMPAAALILYIVGIAYIYPDRRKLPAGYHWGAAPVVQQARSALWPRPGARAGLPVCFESRSLGPRIPTSQDFLPGGPRSRRMFGAKSTGPQRLDVPRYLPKAKFAAHFTRCAPVRRLFVPPLRHVFDFYPRSLRQRPGACLHQARPAYTRARRPAFSCAAIARS